MTCKHCIDGICTSRCISITNIEGATKCLNESTLSINAVSGHSNPITHNAFLNLIATRSLSTTALKLTVRT